MCWRTAARMKAVPVALRALGISTAICGGMAVAAAAAVKLSGLETREVAEVASLADAVAVARQAARGHAGGVQAQARGRHALRERSVVRLGALPGTSPRQGRGGEGLLVPLS
eukprot:jgi/Tetstr1/428491/TSEL_018502.t1